MKNISLTTNQLFVTTPSVFKISSTSHTTDLKKNIDMTISQFPDNVKKFLKSKIFYGMYASSVINASFISKHLFYTKYSLSDSILNIMHSSINNSKLDTKFNQLQNSNTFFFGDVHCQLDLFFQNLCIAGIIDKSGSVLNNQNRKKTIVQLGDVIGTGVFELETLIYIKALQNQCAKKDMDFVRIAGNHEFWLINTPQTSKYKQVLREILIEDCLNDKIKLAYADNDHNFFALHGGLQKGTLIKTLINMSKSEKFSSHLYNKQKQLLELYLNYSAKKIVDKTSESNYHKELSQSTSTSKIYKEFVYDCNLKLTDIADFMNQEFKKTILALKNLDKQIYYYHPQKYLLLHENSVLHTRKKVFCKQSAERVKNMSNYIIQPDEHKYKLKPFQFVGHNCTNNRLFNFMGKTGGIMQNKATIFCDVGLTSRHGSNQAFVSLDTTTGEAYATEICNNEKMLRGHDNKNMPICLDKKISNIYIRNLEGIKIPHM